MNSYFLMSREMAGRGRPRTRRASQAESQQTPSEQQPAQSEPQQAPPEPQQAPQYLVDLMAPPIARMTPIEDLVTTHIAPRTPPPPVAQQQGIPAVPVRERPPEVTPAAIPVTVPDRATEQETWLRMVERYQKMRAPEFQGSPDPLAAHRWKEDVGNILDILGVDSVQKQRLTSYSLKGDVGRWYRL